MARDKDTEREGSWLTRPGNGVWAAGAFLGVILLAGIGLLAWILLRGDSNSNSSPRPATTTTVNGSPSQHTDNGGDDTSNADDKGCAGKPVDSNPVKSAPTDVTWKPAGVVSIPSSKSVGPMKSSGHDMTCFAHSQNGAAFAAANITLAAMGWNDNSVIEKRYTPGEGRDEIINQQGQSGQIDLVGYKVTSYDGTHAIVNLAFSQQGQIASLPVAMVWSKGDWYGDGGPTGVATGAQLQSLDGYVTLSK